jgi:hypothetical protein
MQRTDFGFYALTKGAIIGRAEDYLELKRQQSRTADRMSPDSPPLSRDASQEQGAALDPASHTLDLQTH